MELLIRLRSLFSVVISVIVVGQMAFSAPQVGAAPVSAQPYTFVTTNSVYLRDPNLKNPSVIPANSEVTLDPQFVMNTFRTSTPSYDQLQRLFLNPGEFYGRIETRNFIDANDHSKRSDYFFPVSVKTPSGQVSTGHMAVYTYNRVGLLSLKNAPALSAPPRPSEGSSVGCLTCGEPPKTSPTKDLSDVTNAINQNSTNPLWEKYKAFAKEFTDAHPNIPKSQAGYMKRLYVWSLVQKFGVQDAGMILEAVTGFAESPYRSNHTTQLAEIAAIMKVIENRSANRYRRRSRTLLDAGISEDADARLTNVLADWQFSAWNDRDNSLVRILNFNTDTADSVSLYRMTAAFDAQQMMNTGKIEFEGRLNDSRLQHYHANYVVPSWAKKSKRVRPAIVNVDGEEVDISRQRGPVHYFYAGVP